MSSENKDFESFFTFGIIKEIKGLEYGGEEQITCCNCNKELFVIMKVSDRPTIINLGAFGRVSVQTQYFVSNCPFCGDKSWKTKIDGQSMIRASHGKTVIANISTDMLGGEHVINTLEIVKDNNGDNGE